MEYIIDDNYVPLNSSLSSIEYLMEKILIDVQYVKSLAEGIDDDDDNYDDDYDDDDYDDYDDDDRAGLQVIKLEGQLQIYRQELEFLRQNLSLVAGTLDHLKNDAEEARDAVHKLRHDIDWYGETR
ncbi:hypothetical protein [uncultured Dialister sp.]|uniref:hypothetical protein n=1 Tax=uncultured Dialister sp. TaxID=278064 RepID=UPI0027DDF62C|nr:hypothetical protein [uncultured Dialister sp.]